MWGHESNLSIVRCGTIIIQWHTGHEGEGLIKNHYKLLKYFFSLHNASCIYKLTEHYIW